MNKKGLMVSVFVLSLGLTACGSDSQPDADNDGIEDAVDNCLNIANDNQLNTDATFENGDLLGDACDDDDDADGVLDDEDDLPLNPTESTDTDQDTIGDNTDNCLTVANPDQLNNDQDALGNACDAFINDATETIDSDGDGIGDNQDNCLNTANPYQLNTDATFENGDAFGNACDSDDDADNVADASDDLPLDPTDSVDTDGDGYGNNNGSDFFPNDATEWKDTDFDGVGDNADIFPTNATEWSDLDGDQIGDNADPDKDGDTYNNELDKFPEDATEWADNDPNEDGEIVGDGIGDNQDLDLTSTNVNSIIIERMVAVTPNRATKFTMTDSISEGLNVSSAGDVNHDGIDDLLISNSRYSTDEFKSIGMAYLVFGQQGGWPANVNLGDLASLTAAGIQYVQFTATTEAYPLYIALGTELGSLGDINHDGIDDFYLSIFRTGIEEKADGGEVLMVFGRETWPDQQVTLSELRNSYAHSIYSVGSYGYFGYKVIEAGDLNDDGINDLVITNPNLNDDFGLGAAYILFGSNSLSIGREAIDDVPYINAVPEGHVGFSKSVLLDVEGGSSFDLGRDVQALDDFNQDGFDDIALTSGRADIVLFGRDTADWFTVKNSDDLTQGDGFKIVGNVSFRSLAAGDLNGDDVKDLVIADQRHNSDTGAVSVVFGNQGPWPALLTEQILLDDIGTTYGVIFKGDEINTSFGSDIAVMKDTNADGRDELLVSKSLISNDSNDPPENNKMGQVFKIHGASNWGVQPDYKALTQEWIKGENDEKNIRRDVIAGGDFNGDGQQDVIFIAGDTDYAAMGAPTLYLVYGYDNLYPGADDE